MERDFSSAFRSVIRRICRDEAVRVLVNQMLDWRGVPISLGPGKPHVVTYADIMRDLEPLNEGRDKWNRITYSHLWVHAKRHYEPAGIAAYWQARIDKLLGNTQGDNGGDLLNRRK